MIFDVVFLDITANKYYDRLTVEKEPLGGTEASIVRIAEGLGSLGLKVAVVQSRVPYFEPILGQYAFFMHADDIPKMVCRHFVQIRSISNSHLFPKAKKYVWLHDLAEPKIAEWKETLEKNKMFVVCVSKWHRDSVKQYLPYYSDIGYIYNPCPEHLYTDVDKREPYDTNLMVWSSSPHKGLGKALELFKEIKKQRPKMTLLIFNPGYFKLDIITQPGTACYGPTNAATVWSQVKKALCVFYPTQWDETFGCVASEANALGTPIATYERAALAEVVSSTDQMVKQDDEKAFIDMVLKWSDGGRPTVYGVDNYSQTNVVLEWVKLLAKEDAPSIELIKP